MAHTPTMTPLVPREGQGFRVDLVITPPDNVPGEEYTISPVVGPATGLVLDTPTATVLPFAAGASSTLTFRSTHGFPAAGAYTLEIFKTLDPMTVLATVAVTVAAAAPPPPPGTPLAASITTPGAGAVLHGVSNIVMAGIGGTAPYVHILRVNGVQVYTGAGNTFAWDTAPFANGTHELRLTVRDSTGARARVSINVNVNNVAPPAAVPPVVAPPAPMPRIPGPRVYNAGNWGLAILAFVIPTVLAVGALWWVWSEVKSGLNEFPKGAYPTSVTVPASSGTTTNNGPVQSCTLGSTCINNQPPGPAAPPVPGGSGGKAAPPPPPPPPPAGASGAASTGGWRTWESPCRLTKAGGSC